MLKNWKNDSEKNEQKTEDDAIVVSMKEGELSEAPGNRTEEKNKELI